MRNFVGLVFEGCGVPMPPWWACRSQLGRTTLEFLELCADTCIYIYIYIYIYMHIHISNIYRGPWAWGPREPTFSSMGWSPLRHFEYEGSLIGELESGVFLNSFSCL